MRWIERMRYDTALGMRRTARLDVAHGEAGRARRDDHVGRQQLVELPRELLLEVDPLGAVLLHEVHALTAVKRARRASAWNAESASNRSMVAGPKGCSQPCSRHCRQHLRQPRTRRNPPLLRRRFRSVFSSTKAKARIDAAYAAQIGFVERLVWFWSNHFCVSADKVPAMAGTYDV